MTKGNGEIIGYDLFGQPIRKQKALRDDFIEPPFSVLDTKGANWANRKNKWKTALCKDWPTMVSNLLTM